MNDKLSRMYGDVNILEYCTSEQLNIFETTGSRWTLDVRINKGDWETIASFNSKPDQSKIDELIKIGKNLCEVYHKSLSFPKFSLIY